MLVNGWGDWARALFVGTACELLGACVWVCSPGAYVWTTKGRWRAFKG